MSRIRARRARGGFTIAEVLTVLVLVGIMLAFSLPKVVLYYRQAAVHSARDRFIAKHALARATAVRFGTVAEFHIDAANDRFWVMVDTSTSGAGVMDTIGRVTDYSNSSVAITANRSVVCFDDAGAITAGPGVCENPDIKAYFSSSGRTDSVVVTALGRVVR